MSLLKPFGAKSGTVFCLYNNKPADSHTAINELEGDVNVLLVQLFSRNTIVTFHKRSHRYSLKAKEGRTGWLEVPHDSLQRPGIELLNVTMKEGGL